MGQQRGPLLAQRRGGTGGREGLQSVKRVELPPKQNGLPRSRGLRLKVPLTTIGHTERRNTISLLRNNPGSLQQLTPEKEHQNLGNVQGPLYSQRNYSHRTNTRRSPPE